MQSFLIAVGLATSAAFSVLPARAPAASVVRRAASVQLQADAPPAFTKPMTVGDAKVAFNGFYGRPVGVAAQGFVSEMLTSTQFALVAPNYAYSRVFAVGYTSLCKVFLQGQPSDADRDALRTSMASALGMDPAVLAADAQAMLGAASGEDALFAGDDFKAIASAPGGFKYTYSFGAGLISLMQAAEVEPTDEAIERWCEKLSIGPGVLKRDYAYYVSSIEKMDGMKEMMLQMQAAAKRNEAAKLKKQAEDAEAEAAKAAAEAAGGPVAEATPVADAAPAEPEA